MGHKGVPVLCGNLNTGDKYPWILEGLAEARPRSHPLLYKVLDVKGQSQASEVEVAEWLHRMDKGLQEEDMVTDANLSRGWEAQYVLVIDVIGKYWQNLVVRAMAHAVVVRVDNYR